jgi:hypothetical protein
LSVKQPAGGGIEQYAGRDARPLLSKSRPAAAPRSFDNEVSRMQQSIQRSGAEKCIREG